MMTASGKRCTKGRIDAGGRKTIFRPLFSSPQKDLIRMTTLKALLLLSTLAVACATRQAAGQKIQYPDTRKGDQVDDYHGTNVADPYRWLEDANSTETAAWVEAQNKVTFAYLHALPEREKLRARLTKIWDYPKVRTPAKHGGLYFVHKNDGLQNQDVLYVQKS